MSNHLQAGIAATITLFLCGPGIAFLPAAAIAGILGLPFQQVFYTAWVLITTPGLLWIGFATGFIKVSKQ